jgi:hypothetical protein
MMGSTHYWKKKQINRVSILKRTQLDFNRQQRGFSYLANPQRVENGGVFSKLGANPLEVDLDNEILDQQEVVVLLGIKEEIIHVELSFEVLLWCFAGLVKRHFFGPLFVSLVLVGIWPNEA